MIDFNLPIWLAIIALFPFAWARIEARHAATSRGLASIVLGAAFFAFGLVNLSPHDKLFIWSLISVGFIVALFGTARFVAWQIKNTS